MKKFNLAILVLLVLCTKTFGQTTLANFDFNGGTSYPITATSTASDVVSSISGNETNASYNGTITGTQAFVQNNTAGNSISMASSSGTNTKFWTLTLTGSGLTSFQSYKLYFQSQRSNTGATSINVFYSTDGSNYTLLGQTATPGNQTYSESTFDLGSITTLNGATSIYIKFAASGASGNGTLRIDNLQVQASTNGGSGSNPWVTSGNNISFNGGSVNIAGDIIPGTSKLTVTGNSTFNGLLTANQGLDLGGGTYFRTYTSPTSGVGKIIAAGVSGPLNPNPNSGDDPAPCVVGGATGWLNNGTNGLYSSQTFGANKAWFTQFVDQTNGNSYLDASGTTGSGPVELRINEKCNNNTRINWVSGSVFMGQYVFMKNNLEIGDPTNGMVTGTGILLNIKNSVGFHANIIGNAPTAGIDAFKLSKGGADRFKVNGEGQTLINSINSDALIVKNNSNNLNGFTIKNDGTAIINTYASYNGQGSIFTVKNMNLSASPNAWNNSVFEVQADGKTFIGNQRQNTGPHTDALLHVNGKMAAQSCYIRIVQWADYVFAKDYEVPSLYDVEKYYLANKHLPEVPTEKEVAENGIEVGEMNTILLKKIEEMTIQMVQMKKEIDVLNGKVK
jgi:hypothetical protein